MALSDEDREHARALGAQLAQSLSEAQLDLVEDVAASAPREQRTNHDDVTVTRRAS